MLGNPLVVGGDGRFVFIEPLILPACLELCEKRIFEDLRQIEFVLTSGYEEILVDRQVNRPAARGFVVGEFLGGHPNNFPMLNGRS